MSFSTLCASHSSIIENNPNIRHVFFLLAVVLILISNTLCTGALLNNYHGNGRLVLTSAHCLEGSSGSIEDSAMQNAAFYFNAETPSCESNSGPDFSQIDVSILSLYI